MIVILTVLSIKSILIASLLQSASPSILTMH